MESSEMQRLYDAMEHRLKLVKTGFRRYLYPKIDWRDHLICIKGARGTGKTTLLLQRYLEAFKGNRGGGALYVSADDLWFSKHSLKDVADYLCSHGVGHLFIDEVHHAEDWQRTIKNIADEYGELDVVYSGSSLLKRPAVYDLRGMSFREFLEFEGVASFHALTLEELLANHREIALELTSKVKVLPHFAKYLMCGFYPFYKSVHGMYESRLNEIANQVLESDLPAVEDVSPATIRKIKRMLMVLAGSCPQLPKMNSLYAELETTRAQGLKMLDILERAALLQQLKSEKATLKDLSRPDKIFPDNPNMMRAFTTRADVGTMREAFFLRL